MSIQVKSYKLPSKGKRLNWKAVDEFMIVKIMPISIKGKVVSPMAHRKVKDSVQPKLIP